MNTGKDNHCPEGKRLRGKAVAGSLLALVLVAALFFCVLQLGRRLIGNEEKERNAIRIEGIRKAMDWFLETITEAQESFERYLQTDMELIRVAAQGILESNAEPEPFLIVDGAIVQVADGTIRYPAGSPGGLDELTPDTLTDGFSWRSMFLDKGDGDKQMVVSAQKIRDGWYCLKWIPYSEMTSYLTDFSQASESLRSIVQTYGGSFFIYLDEDPDIILYTSDDLGSGSQAAELGISADTLEQKPGEMTVLGTTYTSFYAKMESVGGTVVFLAPTGQQSGRSFSWGVPVVILAALILAGILVWILSVQFYVRDCILTEEQKKQYHPRRVLRSTVIAAILGTVAIFLAAVLTEMIGSVQMDAERNLNNLDVLENRLNVYTEQKEKILEKRTNWYFSYLEDAAELLSRSTGIRTRETLAGMNRAIGGKYLTLYNESGNEIASSEDYVGFSLGTSADSETTDFRRLNLGIRRIIHEAAADEMTGETVQLIGVPVRLRENGRFGALILAAEPISVPDSLDREEINGFLEYIGQVNHKLLAVNKDGLIVFARNEEHRNRQAEDFGLTEETRKEGSLVTYRFNGEQCYGCCRMIGSHLYFYILTESRYLTRDALPYGAVTAAAFACACLLLILFLMTGYTEKFFERFAEIGKVVLRGNTVQVVLPDGRTKRTVDPSRRWRFFQDAWSRKEPEQKVKLAIQVIAAVLLILIFLNVWLSAGDSRFSLLSYILQGQWERGLNIFAATAILLLLAGTVMGLFVVRLVFELLGKVLGTRGETVCRLACSIIRYIAIILACFYAFSFLGIDTTALLAGVSLLSLAISLGSKDLVADILAGINIVMEGEFQVGDTIEIGGYRGVVQEIGIRSTKIIGMGDNVKIIGNRDVKNVLNLTQMNSWCVLEFNLPVNTDMERVEEILKRELPEIGRRIPEVISGPVYKGISAMAGGNMTLTILAECREEYMRRVTRRLNAAIRELLAKEEIPFS
jgi:small conductance mechanosensitive channel